MPGPNPTSMPCPICLSPADHCRCEERPTSRLTTLRVGVGDEITLGQWRLSFRDYRGGRMTVEVFGSQVPIEHRRG